MTSSSRGPLQALRVWGPAGVGMAARGVFDYVTGSELRVFPLYCAPISFLAWHRGRGGAIIAAVLSTAAWFEPNMLAGLGFSSPGIWAATTFVQFSSCAIGGLLIATLRSALLRERGISRSDPLTALSNRRGFHLDAGRIPERCRRTGRPRPSPISASTTSSGSTTPSDTRPATIGCAAWPSICAPRSVPATCAPGSVATSSWSSFALVAPSDRRIAVSIGTVAFLAAPDSVEEMVRRADARMYEAKATGRDCVQLEVVEHQGTA